MPVLWLWLFLRSFESRVFIQLQYKSDLSRYAEISRWQNTDFVDKGFSVQLSLVPLNIENIAHFERLDLHDVAYVDVWDPLRLVQIAQDRSHVRLVLLRDSFDQLFIICLKIIKLPCPPSDLRFFRLVGHLPWFFYQTELNFGYDRQNPFGRFFDHR